MAALFPAKLYVYLVIALGVFAVGATSAWQIQNWRYGKKEAERLAQVVKAGEKQTTTDNKLGEERVKTVTVYKQGATKIVEKIVYDTIKNPADARCDRSSDGLRALTNLINTANSAR